MKHKLTSLMALAVGFVFAMPAMAQITTSNQAYDDLSTSLGQEDPVIIVTNLINYGLSLLALVAVIFMIIGGFKWMTAAGDQGKVDKARKLIIGAIVGIAFITASWGLATFVINKLAEQTGATVQ